MFAKKEHNATNENVINGSINLIGQGTTITGDLTCKGDIRIDGEIIGNVISLAKVVIGATGSVKGDVIGSNADISGVLTGDLTVNDTLFLKGSAVLNGDIVTNKLIVEAGAVFTGNCNMGASSKKGNLSISKSEKSRAAIEEGVQ
ncbi:MAG: polymer-forming cytoskeletal protein [bacterium]|jgi:cytoskeletal protein CcmA (bactofilin family)